MHLKKIKLKRKRLQIYRKLHPCNSTHSSQGLISLNGFQVFIGNISSLRRIMNLVLKLMGSLTFSMLLLFPMMPVKKNLNLPYKIHKKVAKSFIEDWQEERFWKHPWKMTKNSRRELILS